MNYFLVNIISKKTDRIPSDIFIYIHLYYINNHLFPFIKFKHQKFKFNQNFKLLLLPIYIYIFLLRSLNVFLEAEIKL